jgi:hypothetical protein
MARGPRAAQRTIDGEDDQRTMRTEGKGEEFHPLRSRNSQHLIDKPATVTANTWIDELKNRNPNRQLLQESIVLHGIRARRVLYLNEDRTETDVVYVVHGSRTFQISLNGFSPEQRVRNLPYYEIYQQMLLTVQFLRY